MTTFAPDEDKFINELINELFDGLNEDEFDGSVDDLIGLRKADTNADLAKLLLEQVERAEREQKAPDPEEHIRKPPPIHSKDKSVLCIKRKWNAPFIGHVKEGEPIPPGAEIIQGSPTTIEMARDFLHPTIQTIVDEDALERLAYAIDINRFAYAMYKICREQKTQQTEGKKRTNRIAEYTKRIETSKTDAARRRLRVLWLEELEGGSEGIIDWIMEDPERAIKKLLPGRRFLFNPWHECSKNLARTYVRLFGKTERLTKQRVCSKTGTLVHFLGNALEEITGQSHQPAAIAKMLREELKAGMG